MYNLNMDERSIRQQMECGEDLSVPLDISTEVCEIIEAPNDPKSPGKTFDIRELMNRPDIYNAPILKLELKWYGVDWAKWVKSWLEYMRFSGPKQIRKAAIICTRLEMESAANVFASGVEWINSESEESKE